MQQYVVVVDMWVQLAHMRSGGNLLPQQQSLRLVHTCDRLPLLLLSDAIMRQGEPDTYGPISRIWWVAGALLVGSLGLAGMGQAGV